MLRRPDACTDGPGAAFGVKHRDDTWFRSNPPLANTAFADGSVRSIRYSVELDTFKKACGRNDKQPYNLDDL